MKTNLLRTSIAAVLAAAAAFAQISTPVQANVPFDFIVAGQTMHAGPYTVKQATPAVLIVKAADGKANAAVMGVGMHSLFSQEGCRLVFHRYGNTYFLSEIWSSGSDGQKLPETRREREMAARVTPPNTVIVAMR